LKKGRLSQSLKAALAVYYRSFLTDTRYLDNRWRRWETAGAVLKYRAVTAAGTAGWILYDPARSTIEEILAKEPSAGGDAERLMIDALIPLG
jgi:hypothetical protein